MRVKVINKRPASVLQKKRVCAYARVSTDSRRQEDSLENQMETYERLITGNPEYEFIGVFADQGQRGNGQRRRILGHRGRGHLRAVRLGRRRALRRRYVAEQRIQTAPQTCRMCPLKKKKNLTGYAESMG